MRAAASRAFFLLSKGVYGISPWNRGFVNSAPANRRNPIVRRRVLRLAGFARRSSLATSGCFAQATLEQFNADIALLSSDGFSLSEDLSYANADDASVSRKMALRAKRCVALVTGPNFDRNARVIGVPIGDIDDLITDAVPIGPHEELAEAAISVIETPAMRAGQAA